MDKSSQTIKLTDGRVLGFAEFGDPEGKPLFFFHGWPSARLAAGKFDVLARRLHIRIIAPDRPGYGISDFKKSRTILDWPDDVAELADALKIKQFSIIGVSGGGPYAAVCAYKIPSRLTRVGIVVGLAPVWDWKSLHGMTLPIRVGWSRMGKYFGLRKFAVLVQYLSVRHRFEQLIYIKNVFRSAIDRKMLRDPALNRSIQTCYEEAFRRGIDGPLLDLHLYTTNWGFDVSSIKTPTFLWYGQNDRTVPVSMRNYYKTRIIGSKLMVFPGEGHLCTITHAEEIFNTLVV